MCADVSDLVTIEAEISKLKPIHLLVNNAGVAQLQHFLDVTPDSYDRYLEPTIISIVGANFSIFSE